MKKISEILDGVKTVGIAGHVRPDGDCVGSCMGLYLYLKEVYPMLETDIYLESPQPVFDYIACIDEVKTKADSTKAYDLFILLDVSSADRIGVAADCFAHAKKTCCIDHHISNPGIADINEVRSDVSSASETLYTLLEEEKISVSCGEAIYTGMVHDTGVFQYSSTSRQTMEIAGRLMEKGFDFNKIIDESFYQKTYLQNQILGRVLAESILLLDGQCIAGVLRQKDMAFYGVEGRDLDGIVNQLRLTKGVKAAIFIYETEPMRYKVSLRSNGNIDVNKVAVYFGGGGHVRAAGCSMQGVWHDVINNLTEQIEKQLLEGRA